MKIRDGDVLAIFGEEFVVRSAEIGGAPEFLDRRVRDKIKRQFSLRARGIMRGLPATMRPARLTIRDTRSRWGSCSSGRGISLSWRLAFAPPEVMRYVVVHECCHLEQMNHSRDFWNLVEKYCPDYKTPRAWLRKNGHKLFDI